MKKAHFNQKYSDKFLSEFMRYYADHSYSECAKKYKVPIVRIKTYTYLARKRGLEFKRKDFRRKDAWALKETLFLIRNAGIVPREYIAKRLKRGSYHSVKEALARLKCSSVYINGIPASWFHIEKIKKRAIETRARSGGNKKNKTGFHPKIVLWVDLNELKDLIENDSLKSTIRAMALFQAWIHGTKNRQTIKNRLNKIRREYDRDHKKRR
jgi:hypothetical protein